MENPNRVKITRKTKASILSTEKNRIYRIQQRTRKNVKKRKGYIERTQDRIHDGGPLERSEPFEGAAVKQDTEINLVRQGTPMVYPVDNTSTNGEKSAEKLQISKYAEKKQSEKSRESDEVRQGTPTVYPNGDKSEDKGRAFKKKQVKEYVDRKKAGKGIAGAASNTVGEIAKETAFSVVRVHKRAAEKAIDEGSKSTDFDNGGSQSYNARAAAVIGAGLKKAADPESGVKAAGALIHSPRKLRTRAKNIRHSVRGVRQSAEGIRESAAGMSAAVKSFQRAQYINDLVAQSKGQQALTTTKNAAELVGRIGKELFAMLMRAIKAAVVVSASLWWMAAIAVTLIVMAFSVISLLASSYSIFLSDDPNNETSIQQIVKDVNNDYRQRTEKLIDDYNDRDVALIRYEGNKVQWKYILAIYTVKYLSEGEDITTVDSKTAERIKDIFYDFHELSADYTYEDAPPSPYTEGVVWKVLVITTTAKTPSEIMDKYKFTDEDREQVMEVVSNDTDDMWNELLYGHNGNGGYALIEIAREQLGQSGAAYTSWFGIKYTNGLEWSGCFASWCANEAGYVEQGLYPRFNDKNAAIEWFKEKGLWEIPDNRPNVGDTIFLDTNRDGICDLCGLVERCESDRLYFITQDDVVTREWYLYKSGDIMGYGVLPQMSGLRGDTVEEQIYNYLRQQGYSAVSAIAVLANFQGECSCDPNVFARDQGDAAGLMMWTDNSLVSNKTYFKDWCADNALDWRNLESQLVFFEHWLDIQEGLWGTASAAYHSDFKLVNSTAEFKSISASDYDGDIARALYEATVIFVDDFERPTNRVAAEQRRYTYAVQFYNIMIENTVDGSTISAWSSAYSNDIGVFHLY